MDLTQNANVVGIPLALKKGSVQAQLSPKHGKFKIVDLKIPGDQEAWGPLIVLKHQTLWCPRYEESCLPFLSPSPFRKECPEPLKNFCLLPLA